VQKASRHLLIPRNAFVRESESVGYVYTVSSNNRIFKTPVICEEYDDDQLIVQRGLSENDRVVLHPILNLMDGTRIRIAERSHE
jgi:multidrug efflux pump subunit AcrA (membrane-fusion protein)